MILLQYTSKASEIIERHNCNMEGREESLARRAPWPPDLQASGAPCGGGRRCGRRGEGRRQGGGGGTPGCGKEPLRRRTPGSGKERFERGGAARVAQEGCAGERPRRGAAVSGSLLLRAGAHGSGGAAPRAAREGAAASISLLPEWGRTVWSGRSDVGQVNKDNAASEWRRASHVWR